MTDVMSAQLNVPKSCTNPEEGQGSAPLKNHKNIGYLSNTGPDPLKITKLNVGPSSTRQRNAI